MPNGTVLLMPGSANLPDGSASNAAAGMSRRQGTESSPKKHFLTLDYIGTGTTLEHAWWYFRMPEDYASGGTLQILWMANATSGSCVWQAKVGAITASDTDTPLEHAQAAAATVTTATNVTEARRLNTSSITLTMDSAAAGDLVFLLIYRDPANGSDSLTVDAELIAAAFEYVRS